MNGVSSIVAEVLIVAIVVGLSAVLYYSYQATLSQTTSSAQSNLENFNSTLLIEGAEASTPYTWILYLRNVGSSPLDLNALRAYLLDSKGNICASSMGYISSGDRIPPHSSQKVLFYGDPGCPLKDFSFIKVSTGAFSISSPLHVSRDIDLWMPFKGVEQDWSGKHRVYYERRSSVATFYHMKDGHAYNVDWNTDLREGIKGSYIFIPYDRGIKVVVQESNDPSFDDEFTISLWIYIPEDFLEHNTYRRPITRGKDTNRSWSIIYNHNHGFIEWEAYRTSGPSCVSNIMRPIPGWHHIILYHKDNGPEGVWVDGEKVKSCSTSGALRDVNYPITIGAWYDGPNWWYGGIDEVRYYGKVLSENEIRDLFQGKDVRDGLIFYYSFERNTIGMEKNIVYDVHNWATGRYGRGVYLTDKDPLENVHLPGIDPFKPYTISFWFKVIDDNYGYPINDWGGPEFGPYLGGNIVRMKFSGSSYTDIDYNIVPGWYYTAISFTPTSSTSGIGRTVLITPEGNVFYVEKNDVIIGGGKEADLYHLYLHCAVSDNNCSSTDPSMIFDGIIDEVRVYKRALSREEMLCIYRSRDCLLGDQNLYEYFTFDWPGSVYLDLPEWNLSYALPRMGKYLDDEGDSFLYVFNHPLKDGDRTIVEVVEPKDLNNVGWQKLLSQGRDGYIDLRFITRTIRRTPTTWISV